jgi:hypothetical protein
MAFGRFHRARRDGSAMVVALVVMTAAAGLAYLTLSTSTSALEYTSSQVTTLRLRSAATAAADLLAQDVWDDFLNYGGGTAGDITAFRTFLANPAGNGLGAALNDSGTGGATLDALPALNLPAGSNHLPQFAGITVSQLTIRRTDATSRTDVEIVASTQASADAGAQHQSIRQILSVAGEPFHGFEYALLSNNVNCIMCHASIDNVTRFYNKDSSKYGTFDRVRVGTLESMLVRTPKSAGYLPLPYSNLAGTLYVRGLLMDNNGGLLNDLTGSTVTGDEFGNTGLLLQDSKGGLQQTELTLASGDPLPAYGHMYTNYPTDPSKQADGILPSSFPPPIPDENGNRKVDGTEFQDASSSANGTLSSGVLYEVSPGSSYSGKLPTSSNTSLISGVSSNNVFVVGTAANPVVLDGTVAIEGDVVIQGVIKGNGTILASGNIYVLGDLTYADGTDSNGNRTFGVAADGTTNGLALAAGGNVIVGDYIDDKRGNMVTGDGSGAFNFTMSEITIFNRDEWSKTQKQLPDKTGKLVDNPLYVANYLPRYYVMGNGDPVFAYNKIGSSKNPTIWFDAATSTWRGQEHPSAYDSTISEYKPGNPVYDNATIITLGSNANWMSESTLKGFWGETDKKHSSGPMEVDALLYSNNSAWTLVRDTSIYKGKLTLNGGLVAADTGVLVIQSSGTGLQLNYDARQKTKLHLTESNGSVQMVRTLWLVASN